MQSGRVFMAVVIACSAAFSAVANTTLEFQNGAVVARVSRGAKTAWFAVESFRGAYRTRTTERRFLLSDDDNDGIVRVDTGAQGEAIWMVIDLANGDYAVGAPPNIEARRKPLPQSSIVPPGNGRGAQVSYPGGVLVFWLARPGVGAWAFMVEDGDTAAGDTASDGQLTPLLTALTPVGDSPPAPAEFRKGDVIAVVSPETLQIFDAVVNHE
jgi:hypothetical protein